MAEIKMSSFVISLIVVSLIMTGFLLLMKEGATNYDVEFNNETDIEVMIKLDELSTYANKTAEDTKINERSGITDIVGGYFSSGYNALRTAASSVDIFWEMTKGATKNIDMGGLNKPITQAIMSIVLILIFIGIVLSAIMKRNM